MLLTDIQANILRPLKLQSQRILFLRFEPQADKRQLRSFFATLSPTKAAEQAANSAMNIMLSYAGMTKLGLNMTAFDEYVGFKMSMANSMGQRLLTAYTHIDAAIILHGADELRLLHQSQLLEQRIATSTLFAPIQIECGQQIYNEEGASIEHFGFRDGISEPRVYDEAGNLRADYAKQSFLFEEQTGHYGSFFVFQKYEQDVEKFQQLVCKMAQALAIDEECAAAQVIGRYRDGKPLAYKKTPQLVTANTEPDYSEDTFGHACPFHAHIRKMNPRDSRIYSVDSYPDFPRKFLIVTFCGEWKKPLKMLIF